MAERPGVLRIGDRVVFSGAGYSVVALSGSMVRLVAESGETAVVPMAYLAGAPDFAVVGAGPRARLAPTGLLEALPEKAAAAARGWERHLAEVETGLPPGAEPGTAPRPEFDPAARTLTERAQAKAAELGVTLRTVERMLRRYRNQGLWGLVDTRHARRASPTGNVDPRVIAAAAAVIDAEKDASTGTKSRAVRKIRENVEREHGPGAVPMPSNATFYRLLDVLSAGRHTFGPATTRRQAANRPDGAFTPITAARPGELVLMDGTPLDIMAVMDDGVPGRPELVGALDIGTRTLSAAILRPVGAKAVDSAVLLARMMVPEPMRPGWDKALAMSASRIPYKRLATVDERIELAAAKPVIIPDTVVIDHGKVFLSEVFLRAAGTLGISVQPAHQLTPTDKATIERTFGSINTLFCQHVAGYTGRDVTRRGADPAGDNLWSLADLQELLDEWVIAVLRGEPGHDLRVLLVSGLAAHLGSEAADVVGDVAVHRRHLPRRRGVVRRGDLRAELEPVLLVLDAEQLGVGVRVLLAGVGIGAVHVGGYRVRHHLAVGTVFSPFRDRVGQVLAEHAVEGLAVTRPVQAAKHIIERPVLEQHHDQMIQRVIPAPSRHPRPRISRRAPLLAVKPPKAPPVFWPIKAERREFDPQLTHPPGVIPTWWPDMPHCCSCRVTRPPSCIHRQGFIPGRMTDALPSSLGRGRHAVVPRRSPA